MKITKEQCEEFKIKPGVNPLTGRSISIGKITHQQLTKACNDFFAKKSPKKSLSPPPMGPIMHWKVANYKEHDQQLLNMCNYISDRLEDLDEQTSVSKMEMVEFRSIVRIAKGEFSHMPKIVSFCKELLEDIKTKLETKHVKEDQPKYKIYLDMEIKPNRYEIRETISGFHERYESSLRIIDWTIENNDIKTGIDSGTINSLLKDKKYMDYLIKHNIFAYDDIYKKTFESEKVFENLVVKYKKYREIYKKVKGKSPI